VHWTLIIILLLGAALSLSDWRKGILFIVVAGFLQDPLRKIVPGYPLYLQLTVGAALGIAILSAIWKGQPLRMSVLYAGDAGLRQAWSLFIAMILLQSMHTLIAYGNPILSGLGLLTYLAPLLALIIGVYYASSERMIRQFLLIYLLIAVPFGLSIYLSFWYSDSWVLLKAIDEIAGRRLLIYDMGTVLYSYSGVMRVGEIAAWHAGTATMFLIMLATMEKRLAIKIAAGIIVALLIGAIMLTGRRKMLMAIVIFVGVFGFLLSVYWQAGRKVGMLVLLLGIVGGGYFAFQSDDEKRGLYTGRSVTVFGDASDRFSTAVDLATSAFRRGGVFGKGAGVSAQGAQRFGGGGRIVGGSAEAGMGKLIVELGIPGVLIVIFLLWRLHRYFHRLFRVIPRRYRSLNLLLAGLTAAVVANVLTFLVATQIFGDLFVLIMMGLMVSFMFALGYIAKQYTEYEALVARKDASSKGPHAIS